ncbi:hypothetical protein DFH08DRAFT_720183 [Mycena albidolilacea]|uniref:CxC1-like cysteine cluster associated with KDZ transposases domain-containing protein n=1 Tax=Mycena albidolilacea TaxID=1033008 RepID=A0AAD6Z4S7_9AGAR|nr:hypothetical protein DFH08DRAFT_720183 [Mycena albidolilacea]
MAPTTKKKPTNHNHASSRVGPGAQHLSPLKARNNRKKKKVYGLGHEAHLARLRAELDALRGDAGPSEAPQPPLGHEMPVVPDEDASMDDWVDEPLQERADFAPLPPLPPAAPIGPLPTRKERAEKNVRQQCASWTVLLPKLDEPYAQYQHDSHGQPPTFAPLSIAHDCTASCEALIHSTVQCLYISHTQQIRVITCQCMPVGVLLVRHGIFPASPTRPRTGVSIDLLEIYRALFERSCDAITALAAALHTIYDRRGFKVLSSRVGPYYVPVNIR